MNKAIEIDGEFEEDEEETLPQTVEEEESLNIK